MTEEQKLLVKALRALNYMPNQKINTERGGARSYDLAEEFSAYMKTHGIAIYSPEVRAEVP